jgi:hypothetical protein
VGTVFAKLINSDSLIQKLEKHLNNIKRQTKIKDQLNESRRKLSLLNYAFKNIFSTKVL